MNITPTELKRQYEQAVRAYPVIAKVEAARSLPRMFLFAIGSRETNLVNETGDDGHGRGIFQLDDRSHQIPAPFPPKRQAQIAAGMLVSLLEHFALVQDPMRRARCAAAAYNAGPGKVTAQHPDRYTTGGDYGLDVVQRMRTLQRAYPLT